MLDMTRYAIYFAPAHGTAWDKLGSHWLGRDAHTGTSTAQAAIPSVAPEILSGLTQTARHYGFHATLKAPFRLNQKCTEEDLLELAHKFCSRESPLPVLAPTVDISENFLALRPAVPQVKIAQLAFRCVRDFDGLRAPLSQSEFDRHHSKGLTPRQTELLQRWGYPYVDEEFRFHLTLSDDFSGQDKRIAAHIFEGAKHYFAHAISSIPLLIDGLSIFRQDHPDEAFIAMRQVPFGIENQEAPQCDVVSGDGL